MRVRGQNVLIKKVLIKNKCNLGARTRNFDKLSNKHLYLIAVYLHLSSLELGLGLGLGIGLGIGLGLGLGKKV